MSALRNVPSAGLDRLLSRLDGVKAYGPGYRARCPACGGKSQKLSVTEADGGRILLHCFAGCPAAAVVEAAGLELADLFAERLAPETPEERRESQRRLREASWGAALDTLVFEATVVLVAARGLVSLDVPTAEDYQRLKVAVRRVNDAQSVLRGAKAPWRPHAR